MSNKRQTLHTAQAKGYKRLFKTLQYGYIGLSISYAGNTVKYFVAIYKKENGKAAIYLGMPFDFQFR